jgi:hypothetical protein
MKQIEQIKRIQRQYYKKLPESTKVVTRPTKYGNPYKIGIEAKDATEAVKMHDDYLNKMKIEDFDGYSKLIHGLNGFKNVACFCKLGEPCHADNWINHFNNYLPFYP